MLGFIGSFYAYEGLALLLEAVAGDTGRASRASGFCSSVAVRRKPISRGSRRRSASRTRSSSPAAFRTARCSATTTCRRAGVPAPVDAPDRARHAAEAARGDGAGKGAGRFGRGGASRIDPGPGDRSSVQGRGRRRARAQGNRVAGGPAGMAADAGRGPSLRRKPSATGRRASSRYRGVYHGITTRAGVVHARA